MNFPSKLEDFWQNLKNQLNTQWIACKAISDKRSVQYGIKFSYPVFISLVFIGVFFVNPYILFIASLFAFLGIILPLHPFDYVYNQVIAMLVGVDKIPGRGSELQVNSIIALIFTLTVFVLILFSITINYTVLALIYVMSSIFFLCIFLLKTDSNLAK